jgi:predicted transcriptional regulator of viral defense system
MKYIDFRQKLKSPLFTPQELRLAGLKVFNYQLSLWRQKGYLVKVRNGLYLLADRAGEVTAEAAAARVYAPSYISLESALWRYGFIPEVVPAITCVTPKTTRRFHNKLGDYIYRHIKPALFFGYRQAEEPGRRCLIAEPEKALLDLIYFHPGEFKTRRDIAAWRFDLAAIRRTVSRQKIGAYLRIFDDRRLARAWSMIGGGK